MRPNSPQKAGFTLIEMSIVLVVIGLIVGGVLVGQDLIKAAQVRAQISQIEKYNSAVNTFRGKFGGLPGDLQLSLAIEFGFNVTNCNGGPSERNGNGIIEASGAISSSPHYNREDEETLMFWQDLSQVGLIEGAYPNEGGVGGCIHTPTAPGPLSSTQLGEYFPSGKIGNGQFVYVYATPNAVNWYGLSALTSMDAEDYPYSSANIPVNQAYAVDSKADDGVPTTGRIQAVYFNTCCTAIPANASSSDNIASCYNSTTNLYSMSFNSGSGPNCALSFQMQAGD